MTPDGRDPSPGPRTDAQPPSEERPPKTRTPPTTAAGARAVVSAYRHMHQQGHGLVGATKILARMNQVDGFDCPGCAWPDPDDRAATTEFCENGAKAAAMATTRRTLDWRFFQRYSVATLAAQSDYWLAQQGRLVQPLLLRPGSTYYEPLGWDDAFAIVSEKLKELDSPNEAVFYTSGRTSNEAAFLFQLFARAFGTNNLPDCSNMCHESSGVGLSETVGIGKGSVKLEDFDHADTIIVIGQNPGTNHPRMQSTLQRAKERGAKIIAINPLFEAGLIKFAHPQKPLQLLTGGTALADLYLQVQVNGDVALLKALACLLLDAEEAAPGTVLDARFIEEHTDGFEMLCEHLKEQDVDALSASCGVGVEQLRQAVELILQGPNLIVCWAMGLTQHKNGVANVREIVNLLLLRGAIGKKGAGTCPVRGHSNVQGDRTMGIHDKPSRKLLDKLEEVFGFLPPRKHGYNTVEAIHAMREGRAKVFFAMGGNFLSATPDTERTAEGLRNCELTVHVSTKLNRSHLVHGRWALILPCLTRSESDAQAYGEQFVTVENSMGVIHSSKGHMAPLAAELHSEPAIVAKLAAATLGENHPIAWRWVIEDYDRVRDLIEQTIAGFESFNERVRKPGGFHLHNAARERVFNTETKKARFTINPAPDLTLPDGAFRMMTIRSHDQYNTTVYGLDDRYRGISGGRRVVLINETEMREAGLAPGGKVDLTNDYGGIERVAEAFTVVPYSLPPRCVATYFPEANVLVPLEKFAKGSFTPASKDVVVRIRPAGQ